MQLTKITSQHRNDFHGVLQCEHCGEERILTSGYDDDYYHNNVIPSFHCHACGKDRAGNLANEKGK